MIRNTQKSPGSYAEPVIEVVRLIVAADRQTGIKTVASLETRAPELQVKPRRLRAIFERDRTPFVSLDEFDRVLLRGAAILRGIAARLRESADRWEAEANWMEARHKNLRGDACSESHVGGSQQKRAA